MYRALYAQSDKLWNRKLLCLWIMDYDAFWPNAKKRWDISVVAVPEMSKQVQVKLN